MKRCTKCKEWKNESEFYRDKGKKDGLRNDCKECNNQNSRKYHWIYREERNQYQREYNETHKEERNQKTKEINNSPLPYNSKTRQELEKYEEVREFENGNTACRCAYDGQWFEPIKLQIQARLAAINGKAAKGAEHRLYCSETCKQGCPIFHKQWYERGYEPASSREVQPELRKMRFAKDNWTCQKCGRTRAELIELGLTLHCHHKEGIQWNPIESADIDECITYCKECHREVHGKEGCKPSDMQCLPEWKYYS